MDIVMIPFHDYKKWLREGFRTRDAHLCQHFENFEEIDRILVINRPVSLAEVVGKRMGWKVKSGKIVYKKNGICLSRMTEKIWCLDMLVPDFIKVAKEKKLWWFSAFNKKKVINSIEEAMRYLKMKNTVLMLQNPMSIGVAKKLKFNVFAFDAIDNWIYHPQMQQAKNIVEENYQYVNCKADVIFTVSEALTHTFSENTNVHWVPNGVDADYFFEAIKNEKIGNGILIGYVGKIQDRVDFDLVELCLQEFPECNFEFLGPIYSQRDKIKKLLSRYKNISFKGDIHYDELPQSMKCFDIAIIPHKIDEFTNSMNPLKLYEYLAAGKPVVTTDVAGTEAISQYVYRGDSKISYISQLKKIIQLVQSGEIVQEDISKSLSESVYWDERSKEIVNILVNEHA